MDTMKSACNRSTSLPHTFTYQTGQHRHDLTTTSANIQAHQISSQRRMADREIDIFGAEKYFKGAMDEENRKFDKGKDKVTDDDKRRLQNIKLNFTPRFRRSTSETSCNSQKSLLPEVPRRRTRRHKNKMNGKTFLSTFTWMCSCYNEKSIDTSKTDGENKNTGSDNKNADCRKACMEDPPLVKNIPVASVPMFQKQEDFVSTISSSVITDLTAGKEQADEIEGTEGKALEGFGSPILRKGDKAMSLDKRLTIFAWDLNAGAVEVPAISGRRTQDDEGSDSSSDLFEINNLSENVQPFFKCQESDDDMLNCVTTTCYKTSEANIDWSVVSATSVNMSTASSYQKPETEINYNEKATVKRMCATGKQEKQSHSTLDATVKGQLRQPGMHAACLRDDFQHTKASHNQDLDNQGRVPFEECDQGSRVIKSIRASHSLDMH